MHCPIDAYQLTRWGDIVQMDETYGQYYAAVYLCAQCSRFFVGNSQEKLEPKTKREVGELVKLEPVNNSSFLRAASLTDGDTIRIETEAREEMSKFGKNQLVASVTHLPTKQIAKLGINWASRKNLIQGFGEDTKDWIGKTVTVTMQNGTFGKFPVLSPVTKKR